MSPIRMLGQAGGGLARPTLLMNTTAHGAGGVVLAWIAAASPTNMREHALLA